MMRGTDKNKVARGTRKSLFLSDEVVKKSCNGLLLMKFILTGAKPICPGSDVMVMGIRCAETRGGDVNTTITPMMVRTIVNTLCTQHLQAHCTMPILSQVTPLTLHPVTDGAWLGCFPPFKTLSLSHQIERRLMQNADRSKIPSSLVLIRHILTPGCKYFPFSQNIYLPNQAIHLDDVDIDCVFSNNCSVCRVSRGDDNNQDN